MPIVNVSNSLIAGIQRDLADFWRQPTPTYDELRKALIYPLPWKPIRNMPLVFKETLPFPELWNYGDGRNKKSFKDRIVYGTIKNYSLVIPWSKFDEEDDQLGDLRAHVQRAVIQYKKLPAVLTTEYFNGVPVYNPALVPAYDGVSLFSSVDGNGHARFGVSGGNIVTGSGLTTAGVLNDLFVALDRFMQMRDPTAGLPIFSSDEANLSNLTAIIPTGLMELFTKATKAEIIRSSPDTTMPESNYVKGTFKFMVNPLLTDPNDWYLLLKNDYYKPFAYSEKSVETMIADQSNSDEARNRGENAFYSETRNRLIPFSPVCVIKINN